MHGAIQYKRRQPEKSLLYQVVQDNIGPFIRARAREGKDLPRYVIREFEEYLRRGPLEHGLVRIWCEGSKHELAVALSCKNAAFARAVAEREWSKPRPTWLLIGLWSNPWAKP